jgi:hypothetical protein
MTGARPCLVSMALLGLGLAGCTRPQTCGARGKTTALSGVATYAVGAREGHSMSLDVTVYDYVEGCTYDSEEFPIHIGSCTLWATLQHGPEAPTKYFPGNPSAWARVEPGQACALKLLDGTARVEIESGLIAFADSTTGLLLTGAVTEWISGAGWTGDLQWQFQADGW